MTIRPDETISWWLPRGLAALLAMGGCFWGLLLAAWIFPDPSPMAIAVFGPGYLVTLGYIIRVLSTPSLGVRRCIWIASLFVQGSWLAWITWAMVERAISGQTINEPMLPVVWWVFATVASATSLLVEPAK